jgi:hypothetical protein
MKNGIILAGMVFAVALAVIVGNRLSDEAMAVVVGAVCGISASVPVSVALVIAASRNWGRSEQGQGPREVEYDYGTHRYAPQQPQILVVSAPQQQPYGYQPNQYYPTPLIDDAANSPRQFKIIGDE